MNPPTDDDVLRLLDGYVHPLIGRGLVAAGTLASMRRGAGVVVIDLVLPFPSLGVHGEIAADIDSMMRDAFDHGAQVGFTIRVESHASNSNLKPLPGIRNLIAVASGKGGVGKSTVAANLALALRAEGARVGLLDADIYGPSQPRMMGASERPFSSDGKAMDPVPAHGLQTMSIGYLVDEKQPMVWRGPMATQALMQLVNETRWNDLDYLVLDLPPGTGDIQLTLSQRLPLSGAVLVTTPQDIALLDARKGAEMFAKVGVQVLGVVENMSMFCCPNCGHVSPIFGSGGGERLAAETGAELLGQLPLDARIRDHADNGCPSVVAEPDSDIAVRYRDIARKAAARLAYGAVESFPEIVVSDD